MKKIIKKISKILGVSVITILVLCALFLLVCFVNNQIQLKKEAAIIKPTGKIVKVNGRDMHVYSEGHGDSTCVFMAGLGIRGSNLEFKGLYSKLSDEYRIAVVDRPSYGFSQAANDSRDIDTILEETRQALTAAGEKAPYILFAHSISGIQAIYWAQKYPKEVKAIIGLDMGLPSEYAASGLSKSEQRFNNLESFLVKTGIYRLFPSMVYDTTIINDNFLSKDEKELYKALNYKNALRKDMLTEDNARQANAKKTLTLKLPVKTPILLFSEILTGESLKFITEKKWEKRSKNYVAKFNFGKALFIKGTHCLYLYHPETIAKESKEFIKSIHNN
jgi:pimeloyl-ACP methyl ester carboxylesterase